MTIFTANTILMVGVAGSGMRGLAYLLSAKKKRVLGVDARWENKKIPSNEPAWAGVELGGTLADIVWDEVELLIYSDAVPKDSVWRKEAAVHQIPIISYQVAMGQFAAQRRLVAVAGTHGKSSTTAFLSYVLLQAGYDPTVLVGATTPFLSGGHAQTGSGEILVLEADEYREHFLELHPEILVVTSIDFDHADYFENLEAVVGAFKKLIQGMPTHGLVVVPRAVHEGFDLPWPKKLILVDELKAHQAPAPLPGIHMQMNAALALAVATYLEIPHEEAERSLRNFPGLGRRFEHIGHWKDMLIISDYGHHPVEIAATLKAAREKWKGKRVGILVEIHTEERLKVFREQFIAALKEADRVWLYPIYVPTGREYVVDASQRQSLLEALQTMSVPTELVPKPSDLKRALAEAGEEVDVLLAFSAGDLDQELRNILSN